MRAERCNPPRERSTTGGGGGGYWQKAVVPYEPGNSFSQRVGGEKAQGAKKWHGGENVAVHAKNSPQFDVPAGSMAEVEKTGARTENMK